MADQLSPFEKMNTINSVESDSNIKLNFNATGLSADDQKALQQIMPVLQNLSVKLHTKSVKANSTDATAYVDMSTTVAGVALDFEVWAKTELSSGTPKVLETIKIPKNFPIPLGIDKDYITIDTSAMSKDSNVKMPTLDPSKLTEIGNKFTVILSSLIKDINDNFKLTTDKGDVTVTTPQGDVKAHAFEMKINDSDFKAILKYAINNLYNNKDFMAFLQDYIKTLDPTIDLKDFSKQAALGVATANIVLDNIKDVKVLGDRGIVFDYAVNSDGYIVKESGNIDLVIDIQKLMNAVDPTQKSTETGIFNIGLDFDQTNYNINGNVQIDLPKLTPENSMGLEDLIQKLGVNMNGTPQTNPVVQKPVVKTPAAPATKVAPVKKAPVVASKKTVTAKKIAPKKVVKKKK